MDKNLLLVKMIGKFPCLYKSDSMEYSRRDFTDKAWNEVSKELNLSVNECKEKWKNMRYGFLRSLRPPRDGSIKKKYYMHDEMQFIIPYTRTYATKSKETNPKCTEEESDKEDNLINENTYDNDQFEVSYIEESNDVIEPMRKKLKTYETYNHNIYEQENSKVTFQEDPRRMFLLSLLPEIEDFSESQMKIFRRRILRLVDEINDYDNMLKPDPL